MRKSDLDNFRKMHYPERYGEKMYKEDFTIRDFVKENAKEWGLFETFELVLKEMNNKICYEAMFKDNDVGHLTEYFALAFIRFWDGNTESAARMAEGIKIYIENETKG